MDYPFGHHNHRHHQRDGRGDNEQEEEYPPPAPPSFYPPPPPRQSYYQGDRPPPPPRPPPEGFNYSAFPQQGEGDSSLSYSSSSVQHVSHDPVSPQGSIESETHQHHHLTSFLHHHTHQASELTNKPPVRVFCKAETGYSLTIRDGKVILAPSHHADDFQHWIKDEKYSTKVKDQEGFPSFALINKATGQAMKHSVGATHPVQLVPYNPDVLDESVLWTESKDLGDGFRTIRMVNNIRLNVDAFHGDKNHGGVCDGTTIVLWEWKKGDNQRWKIIPYCKSLNI